MGKVATWEEIHDALTNGNYPPGQKDQKWASAATSEEFFDAYRAGQLLELLGRAPGPTARDAEWVKNATPEEIAAAHNAGALENYKNTPNPKK